MARQTTDYTKGAAAVMQNMDSMYASSRQNSIDPGEIAMTIDDANTDRYRAFIRTAGELAETGIRNQSRLRQYKEGKEVTEDIQKIQAPAKMAGKLAALGKAGIGILAEKKFQDEENERLDAAEKRFDETTRLLKERFERPEEEEPYTPDEIAELGRLGIEIVDGRMKYTGKKTTDTAVGSSDTGRSLEQVEPEKTKEYKPSANSGAFKMNLTNLTNEDWKELGYVVSGEAERGTDDEFGVAASVLNRVKSSEYPNSVAEVARQPGQYHAVEIGNARYDDALTAKLSSPEGMQKLQNALEVLGGRTDFKGQALLHNRVAAEDPMFSSGGNYFHFNYQ